MVWIWLNSPQPTENKLPDKDTVSHRETIADTNVKQEKHTEVKPQEVSDSLGRYFSEHAKRREEIYVINSKYVKARLTSKGAAIKSWELKEYKTWNGDPVNLVNESTRGDLNLLFYTADGKI
ncbi:MAG TPA: hypothetical protein VJ508_02935, partial [Saprospiraceae bacterium]|nr:hypothetical protein [Saprospiraceae bacterium]